MIGGYKILIRSHVSQTTVLHRSRIVIRDIDERHRIQRVSGIGRTIGVDGVVSITMVGDDDGLIIVGLSSLDHLTHAIIHSPNSFGNSIVDTGMTHHILAKFTTMKSYSCVLMAPTSLSFTSKALISGFRS